MNASTNKRETINKLKINTPIYSSNYTEATECINKQKRKINKLKINTPIYSSNYTEANRPNYNEKTDHLHPSYSSFRSPRLRLLPSQRLLRQQRGQNIQVLPSTSTITSITTSSVCCTPRTPDQNRTLRRALGFQRSWSCLSATRSRTV